MFILTFYLVFVCLFMECICACGGVHLEVIEHPEVLGPLFLLCTWSSFSIVCDLGTKHSLLGLVMSALTC